MKTVQVHYLLPLYSSSYSLLRPSQKIMLKVKFVNSLLDACRARGCGNVLVSDGIWKLGYPIW